MAQPSVGTPIQLYYSTTASTAPSSSNLVLGELALNTTDGKLYYKTTGGVVTVLASSAISTGNLPGGSTGTVVYQSATGVTAYLPIGTAGSLLYSNGTLPAYAPIGSAGSLLYSTGTAPASASIGSAGSIVYSNGTAPTSLPIGATDYVLTSSGTTPQYVSQSSLSVGTAASATFATSAGSATTATTATTSTNIAGGASNQIVYQSGSGTTSFVTAPTGAQVGYVLSYTGSGFAWASAPPATSATNIAGGGTNQVPFQSASGVTTFNANFTFTAGTTTLSSPNITATSALSGNTVASTTTVTAGTSVTATTSVTGANLIANGSITPSASTGAISYGTLSYSDVNIFSSYATSVNNYAQKIIQNTNSGSSASVDFIVSNNNGTAIAYYGDFGMNSSTYSGIGSFQQPNVVYLYSATSDLVIGTKSANYLRLVTNDNSADTMILSPTNAVAFNGSYGTAGNLLVTQGTGSAPLWTTLTAGTGISITNVAGNITINGTATGPTTAKVYYMAQF
jgi:hypothetical protein